MSGAIVEWNVNKSVEGTVEGNVGRIVERDVEKSVEGTVEKDVRRIVKRDFKRTVKRNVRGIFDRNEKKAAEELCLSPFSLLCGVAMAERRNKGME